MSNINNTNSINFYLKTLNIINNRIEEFVLNDLDNLNINFNDIENLNLNCDNLKNIRNINGIKSLTVNSKNNLEINFNDDNNLNDIIIKNNCKNIIIKGNYSNLNNICCENNIDYLELNGKFNQLITIKNKKIKVLKLIGTFKDFNINKIDKNINLIIYENYNSESLTCYNNVKLINSQINNIIIKKDIKLTAETDNNNIKHITIDGDGEDCKNIIIKGNYPNLRNIDCNNKINYLELNGNFDGLFQIYNAYSIDVLKFCNSVINNSYFSHNNIFKCIYENVIYNNEEEALKVFTNSKFINCNINYLYINKDVEIEGNFDNVKKLRIYNQNIKEIPYHFINLKELYLFDCINLNYLSDNLTNLEKLHIYNCTNLKDIPSNLTNLKYLYIKNSDINSIPNSLINLTHLNLLNCGKIISIPKSLINLNILYIYKCNKLVSLPNNFIHLKELNAKNIEVPKIYYNFIDNLYCKKLEVLKNNLISKLNNKYKSITFKSTLDLLINLNYLN